MEVVLNNNDMPDSLQTRVAVLEEKTNNITALLDELKTEIKKQNETRFLLIGAVMALETLFNIVDIKTIFKP